jgi:hypothetical protein
VPPTRTDRQLLLVAGGLAVLAGVLVAVVLLLATGRSGPPTEYEPFAAGPEADLARELREGGPFFIADPFGGRRGFWLTLEDREVVPVAVHQSDLPECSVRWRARLDRFTCGDARFRSEQLERFATRVPKAGDDEGVVLVDLRRRLSPGSRSLGRT